MPNKRKTSINRGPHGSKILPSGGDPEDVATKVFRAALALPGARVDRNAFLQRQLSKHVSRSIVKRALASSPAKAGVDEKIVRRLAAGTIRWHRAGVSAVSFAAGLPGGWWLAGTVPADLTQFFWHVIVVLQKLAYLYGWPEIGGDESEPDDETLEILMLFVGVMFGAESAAKILRSMGNRLAGEIVNRVPRAALTKWGYYRLARQVTKWLGETLTKQSFARYLSKLVPVLSGIVSGTVTWVSFSLMSNRLVIHLETLPLAQHKITRRRSRSSRKPRAS